MQTIKLNFSVDVSKNAEGDLEVADILVSIGRWNLSLEHIYLDNMTGPDGSIEDLLTTGDFGEMLLREYEARESEP